MKRYPAGPYEHVPGEMNPKLTLEEEEKMLTYDCLAKSLMEREGLPNTPGNYSRAVERVKEREAKIEEVLG